MVLPTWAAVATISKKLDEHPIPCCSFLRRFKLELCLPPGSILFLATRNQCRTIHYWRIICKELFDLSALIVMNTVKLCRTDRPYVTRIGHIIIILSCCISKFVLA
jgi:hypothetical protein